MIALACLPDFRPRRAPPKHQERRRVARAVAPQPRWPLPAALLVGVDGAVGSAQQCLYGGTSQPASSTQVTGFARVPPVGSKSSARTHSLTHCLGGRGPDLSRTDRSRRLVSGRASRLATLIPPARNGLRIGRTHLSFGSFSKHCSGHVHPSSEASTPLKPSTPRLREPVPSRQTATGPPPACAPRPRSRCASGAPWRS
jgi:hypothetical protein